MKLEMQAELDRLLGLWRRLGFDVELQPGHTESEIRAAERETGLRLNPDLRVLYGLTNGRARHFIEGDDAVIRFGLESDGELPQFDYVDFPEAVESWRRIAAVQAEYRQEYPTRDDRVIGELESKLLLAELPFGDPGIFFDGNPARDGSYGQVVLMDWDYELRWLAPRFLDFFRASNTLLEQLENEDIESFRRWWFMLR